MSSPKSNQRSALPDLDGEYWRRKGYELVMRYGSVKEREQAKKRLDAVLRIRKSVERMAEQRRAA